MTLSSEMLWREPCARVVTWAAPRTGAQPRPASDTLGGEARGQGKGSEKPPIPFPDWLPSAPIGNGLSSSAKQREDILAVRVRDAERLNGELLLNLQSLQPCRFRVHVRIDQLANAAIDGVHERFDKVLL